MSEQQYFYKTKTLVTNLIKNTDKNTKTDMNLRDPHGIEIQQSGTSSGKPEIWVANTNSGLVTHYSLSGCILQPGLLIVPNATTGTGSPTGIVYNPTSGFLITKDSKTAKSVLIVATADGTIAGWNPSVDPTNFITVYNGSTDKSPPVFTSLAILGNLIYATDFKNNKVVTFNNSFVRQSQDDYPFVGPLLEQTPFLSCISISSKDQNLFVAYNIHETHISNWPLLGPGFGAIDEYTNTGFLIRRVVNSFLGGDQSLNAPSSITQFNKNFAENSEEGILSSQKGSGELNIYDMFSGKLLQVLTDHEGKPIFIDNINAVKNYTKIKECKNESYVYYVSGAREYNTGVLGVIKRSKNC